MRSSSVTQTVASTAPNRRQSTRQVRTTASRPANYYARSFTGRGTALGAAEEGPASNAAPGFCPALTHFTDSITALPKEVIRHFSMLKEVEAKIHAPVDQLSSLINTIETLPLPAPHPQQNMSQVAVATSVNGPSDTVIPTFAGNEAVSALVPQGVDPSEAASQTQLLHEQADFDRRKLFFQLRFLLHEASMILDEKNAVLSSANLTLSRQLDRMDSSFAHLGSEISDEARYGSTRHWAYADKESKKTGGTNERTRREVASANNLAAAALAVHEGDIAATRSEARREAMLANRKNRGKHVDSDFDDAPAIPKKGQSNVKARKVTETGKIAEAKTLGLGISGSSQPTKKRKTEKGAVVASAMERSVSATHNPSLNGRAGAASPKITPAADASRKKPKSAAATLASGAKKRIAQAGAQSPLGASSPLQSAFPREFSPVAPRPQSGRTRQNSASNTKLVGPQDDAVIHPAPVLPNKQANGIANPAKPKPVESDAPTNPAVNPAGTAGDPANAQNDSKVEADDVPLASLARGTPRRSQDLTPEAGAATSDNIREVEVALPANVTTRSARASKTATPVTSSFPEHASSRPRNTRNHNSNTSKPPTDQTARSSESTTSAPVPAQKRSHKKGAGQAAQAAQARSNMSASEYAAQLNRVFHEKGIWDAMAVTDEEDEPRYCYCNGVSYGEMVACDNSGCPREWFHLECVGLTRPPGSKKEWYCSDECRLVGRDLLGRE